MSENETSPKPNRAIIIGCSVSAVFIFCIVMAALLVVYRSNIPVVKNYFQTATPIPTPTLTPTPHILVYEPDPNDRVLTENFTTNKNNWSTFYSPGKVEVNNGILSAESFERDGIAIAHCFCENEYQHFTDKYYLQADVSTDRVTANNYGLIFGLAGTGDFYEFTISTQKRFHLEKWNGDWAYLAEGVSPAIRNYPESNTLSVYFNQGKIELFINGEKVTTYKDRTPTSGQIGFVLYGMNFKLLVDNLFVYRDR